FDKTDEEDFALRKRLWDRLEADPEGYASNRDFGLYCSSRRKFVIHAKPYLIKALSLGPNEVDYRDILSNLGEICRLEGDLTGAREIYCDLHGRFPGTVNFLFDIGDADYHLGNIPQSSVVYRQGLDLVQTHAEAIAGRAGGRDRRIIWPSRILYSHIGEIAHKLDLFVKSRRLGLVADFEPVVLAPVDKVANQAFMDCYSTEVTLVSDMEEIDAIVEEEAAGRYFVDYLTIPSGQTLHRELAYGVVQRLWSDRGWGSPIQAPDDVIERGRAMLREYGCGDDDWFVALHVRDSGFYEEDQPWDYNKFRNAPIADYVSAIEAITRRGGWVLRMGDPSMEPLPPMDRVIDYATGPDRQDWMDVFGLSQCRFFVGTASGPMNVARAFCVPVVATNYFPVGTWPFSDGDLVIHKLHRSASDGSW
ncbi:MAG: TIGR04372 family glycosyltransferase, partial [Rhodospirillales bacterium]|nr:TIGR04372 family glycosyltransferase [Rhodospirillales bacterium]